ncbi:hypothetical protein SDC9_67376 [bioreactor metagenome]|uniref:Uncharacterized protein n=1 Tax=bioreactor metagenome TaxID=1076179 RepID=A0A644XYV1_9ZZZZ
MIGGVGNHHVIHIDAGHLDQLRAQRPGLYHLLHLHNYRSAVVSHGLGDGGQLSGRGFFFGGHVAVNVGVGAADETDMNGEGFVEQLFLAVYGNQLDEILRGQTVDLAAAVAGVHEGFQAHMGNGARPLACHIPQQVHKPALGNVIGLAITPQRHGAQLGGRIVMGDDDALEQSLVGVVVAAGAGAVSIGRGIEQCNIIGFSRREEPLLQRLVQCLRQTVAYKSTRDQRVAVLHQQGRFLSRDNFDFSHLFPYLSSRNHCFAADFPKCSGLK